MSIRLFKMSLNSEINVKLRLIFFAKFGSILPNISQLENYWNTCLYACWCIFLHEKKLYFLFMLIEIEYLFLRDFHAFLLFSLILILISLNFMHQFILIFTDSRRLIKSLLLLIILIKCFVL